VETTIEGRTPMSEREVPHAPSSAMLAGVRILLVEDHDDAREMMALLLRSWGAEVTCVDCAEHAYERVTMRDFDLLVADVGLPGVDGFAMLHELRQRGCTMPAVALTGYTSVEDRRRAREVGFAAHLGKPNDPDALLQTLQRLLTIRDT
jgi:CheY-like chemotaxis protein